MLPTGISQGRARRGIATEGLRRMTPESLSPATG